MLNFVARDVPPLGYRTYVPVYEGADRRGPLFADNWDVLENEYLRLRLDPERGTVASLIDKQSGRELIDTSSKYGFGQYLYERFDADMGHAYLVAFCKSHPWPDWAKKDRQTRTCRRPKKCLTRPPRHNSLAYLFLQRGPITSMALMTGPCREKSPARS